MEARRSQKTSRLRLDRRRSPLPGTRLLSLGLAVAVVAVLGYAVLQKSLVTAAKSTEPPANALVDNHDPQGPGAALGRLEAWPPSAALTLEPPAYEIPYVEANPVATIRLRARAMRSIEASPTTLPPSTVAPLILTPDELELPVVEEAPEDEAAAIVVDPGPSARVATQPTEVGAARAGELASRELRLGESKVFASLGSQLFDPPVATARDGASKDRGSVAKSRPSGTAAAKSPARSTVKPASEDFDVDLGDTAARLANEASPRELMLDLPPPGQVAELLAPDVRTAFTLGRHGALYAARTRFIGVLRKVASAKDAELQTDEHSVALAAGLRALEEAVQFVPRGEAIEADLDVAAIAASHGTPLLKDQDNVRWTPPNEAVARYHRYAQHKIAAAVAGNEAGSMALHGLGKTYSRLADLDEAPLAQRTSLTMYRAAVETHPGNYLAANELGVSLAKVGHYDAARETLERAIASGGGSTIHRNLAVVQQKLGQPHLAAATSTRADQLAAVERSQGAFSRQQGVEWVDRQRLARVSDAYGRRAGVAKPQTVATQAAAPETSIADRMMPWRREPVAARFGPVPSPPQGYRPGNPVAPPVRSQTIVR